MAYPLIILGAGASYDYIKLSQRTEPIALKNKFRPPVTKNLFHPRFDRIIKGWSNISDLAASMNADLQNQKKDFESILLNYQVKSVKNGDRKKQLIDLLFYLQNLFKNISHEYGGQPANNYRALIQEVKDGFGKACIVTFNYDLLLEEALSKPLDMDKYNSGDIKYIKAHGSCNWVYPFDDITQRSSRIGKSRDFLIAHPEYPEKNQQNFKPEIYIGKDYEEGDNFYYPAIAIPLPGKTGFICPKTHLSALEECLPEVDRILCIGWRANDSHLINLLEKYLKNNVALMVVNHSHDGAKYVFEKFANIKNVVSKSSYEGFSNFMGSDECKTFFETN